MSKNILSPVAAVAFVSGLFTVDSRASAVLLPVDTLTGLNGLVSIEEYAFGAGGFWDSAVAYAPNVTGGTSVYAVLVSHNDPFTEARSEYSGWGADSAITAASWDDDYELRVAGSFLQSNSLGNFADLFGTDQYVSVYYALAGRGGLPEGLHDGNDIEDASGFTSPEEFPFWRFDAAAATEFIALDNNGQIIDASLPTALQSIPEPSAALLLGLGSLAFLRRRRIG